MNTYSLHHNLWHKIYVQNVYFSFLHNGHQHQAQCKMPLFSNLLCSLLRTGIFCKVLRSWRLRSAINIKSYRYQIFGEQNTHSASSHGLKTKSNLKIAGDFFNVKRDLVNLENPRKMQLGVENTVSAMNDVINIIIYKKYLMS